MDADSRKEAAALVHLIWTDPSQDPKTSLDFLSDLKAEALADGLQQSWPKMDIGRRTLFESWLPEAAAEKDIRRIAFLVRSVIENDPATAVRWLNRLVPREKKSLTKDVRQHLASGLLDTSVDFKGLVQVAQEPRETTRLFGVLWSIATDSALGVPLMSRVRLARAIVAFARSGNAAADDALEALGSQIRHEAGSWPAGLRDEFFAPDTATSVKAVVDANKSTSLQQPAGEIPSTAFAGSREPVSEGLSDDSANAPNARTDEGTGQSLGAAGGPAVASLGGDAPPLADRSGGGLSTDVAKLPEARDIHTTPGAERPVPVVEEVTRLQRRLTERLASIPEELDLVRKVYSLLDRWADDNRLRSTLEQELEAAKQQIIQLRSSVTAVMAERDSTRSEASDHRSRCEQLAETLAQATKHAEDERQRLGQQISLNAAGRIEEYKTRLALSLTRLVRDLPARNAPVSEELGRILLLQFHQFLDALRVEGIDVQPGTGTR
jgi:hypothetical protein